MILLTVKAPSLRWYLLVTLMLLLSMGLTDCSRHSSGESHESLENGPEDSNTFLSQYNNVPDFPTYPRREIHNEDQVYSNVDTTIGLTTEFGGSTFSATTDVTFQKSYKVTTYVVGPGEDALFSSGTDIHFLNSPQRVFVRLCQLTINLTADSAVVGKLQIFGNGVTGQKGLKDATEIVQGSHLEQVPNGETWPNQVAACHAYAVKQQVKIENDLTQATSTLIYHNAENECVLDSHCDAWHDKFFPSVKAVTVARCIANPDGNHFCALRSKVGGDCPVFDATGKRLTSGSFEYTCDKGLGCVVTKPGGWFQDWSIYANAKAQCQGTPATSLHISN